MPWVIFIYVNVDHLHRNLHDLFKNWIISNTLLIMIYFRNKYSIDLLIFIKRYNNLIRKNVTLINFVNTKTAAWDS